MTVLVVSPYPPVRDGIASYAVQEVLGLRRDGLEVEVVSPEPSAAPHHCALGNARGWFRLRRRFGGYERVIIQVYPELMVGATRTWIDRVAAWAAATALARKVPTELRVHELDYSALRRHRQEQDAVRRFIEAADVVTVHTERERDQLVSELGVERSSVQVIDHGTHFTAHVEMTRAEARSELGLDPATHIFASVGFVQSHKGFDRAVNAFARLDAADRAELHIAGSVRVDHPELLSYARWLQHLTAGVAGAELHVRYLSDWEFDLWLIAADTIVLPYREIWSSGVVERAKLFGTYVIAADVGGLADQIDDGEAVSTDDELVAAMAARLGADEIRQAPALDPSDLQKYISEAGAPIGVGTSLTGPGSAVMARLGGPMPAVSAVSERRGVSRIKSVIQRVTAWQVAPILDRLNEVHTATAEAIERMEETPR